ncbi:hypothetical protein NQZ79_g1095 [Umbelopsis isabellina]|nr:hypothetical protein NQZ79_g1095 [Umbelopsis isabellina]
MLRFKKHDKGDDRESSRPEDKDRRDRRRDDDSYRRPRNSSRSPSPRRRRSRERRSRSRSPDRRDRRHRSRSPRDRDRRSGRRDDKPKSERSEKKSTTAGDKPKAQALRVSGRMIEIECNDRLGKKIRVKASPKDTVGDFKKLVAAQIGTEAKKIILKKWYKEFKDHITLDDYEIHDGMNIELYYR